MAQNILQADVVVAGAGPAGSTVARLLALRGRRVVMVDSSRPTVRRLEILAPSSAPLIAALKLEPFLHIANVARPCLGIRRRWRTGELQFDDFFRHPGGRGYVVHRPRLDRILRFAAEEAGVVFLDGQVLGVTKNEGSLTVSITRASKHVTIESGVVIEATGRRAVLARHLGAHRIMSERLVAAKVASVSTTSGEGDPVWLDIEGDPDTWSYSVPGPDGYRETWLVSSPEDFPRRSFIERVDASSAWLSSAAGRHWMAIGDAAASFDPITSQGLINALSTAIYAAGCILSARDSTLEGSSFYSEAVRRTFAYSERGRAQVYAALPTKISAGSREQINLG